MPEYNLDKTFDRKVQNFPDYTYPLGEHDHITKLLKTVLEDAGIGQLKKIQTVARLAEHFGGTEFTELDWFFGEFLSFYRLPEEQYDKEPYSDQLTADEWDEVESKDASYRERLRNFMTAISLGSSPRGMALAAEAACGYPCTILEGFRYEENLGLFEYPGRLSNSPGAREFLVVPSVSNLTASRRKAIYDTIRRLKPASTIVTVDENALDARFAISLRYVTSSSEYFEIRRYVTGHDIVESDERYFWVKNGEEVEAPNFAHMSHQENHWSLNETISTVGTFTFNSRGEINLEPSKMNREGQSFTSWRSFEKADSPDNYPDGRYKGDPARLDSQGNYLFSWQSQKQYEAWMKDSIERLGGQVKGDKYRMPASMSAHSSQSSIPSDALAPPEVKVESLYFVR